MENKKEYCENLYKRYKELKEKVRLEIHDMKPGGGYSPKHVSIKDIEEFIEMKEKIKECLDSLLDDQLVNLWEELDLRDNIAEIFKKRKGL